MLNFSNYGDRDNYSTMTACKIYQNEPALINLKIKLSEDLQF